MKINETSLYSAIPNAIPAIPGPLSSNCFLHHYYSDRTHRIKHGLTGLAPIILGYDESEESVVRKCHYWNAKNWRAGF